MVVLEQTPQSQVQQLDMLAVVAEVETRHLEQQGRLHTEVVLVVVVHREMEMPGMAQQTLAAAGGAIAIST